MDWCAKNIDEINKFLELDEENALTLPNELARYNAKKAFYSKLFSKNEEEVTDNKENGDSSNYDTELVDTNTEVDTNEEMETENTENINQEEED